LSALAQAAAGATLRSLDDAAPARGAHVGPADEDRTADAVARRLAGHARDHLAHLAAATARVA
jgi:hypothetical protein